MLGSYAATYGTYEDAIALIASGRIEVDSAISDVYPLDQMDAAMARLATDRSVVKLHIRP